MSLIALVLAAAVAAPELTVAPEPPAPAPITDPLAPAKTGKLLCSSPDQALATCGALASYVFTKDGAIVSRSEVVVSPRPFTTMTTSASVRVRGAEVCGRLTGVQAATFVIDRKPADEATTAALRTRLGPAFNGFAGVELCTVYVPRWEGFMALISIGGERRPGLDQPVIWVDPAEGYAVRP